jgi:hypothetical protein
MFLNKEFQFEKEDNNYTFQCGNNESEIENKVYQTSNKSNNGLNSIKKIEKN